MPRAAQLGLSWTWISERTALARVAVTEGLRASENVNEKDLSKEGVGDVAQGEGHVPYICGVQPRTI